MIEWSWRVERAQSIAFGSWSGDLKIFNGLKKLENLSVVEVSIEGRLPELVVQLSGNFWLHSFVTVESQPEWCLFLDRNRWVDSANGRLRLTTQAEPR